MEYNFFNDRRKTLRKPVKTRVSLQLTELIKGIGYLKDVTPESLCIVSQELFAFFRREHSEIFQDKNLVVTLMEYGLNIEGKIVRADAATSELVVIVSRISDLDAWKKLCR
ncbi:MAG TPA: hypothetical protein ENN34_11785 [Deltaproteobacteria bacterium]|nr:hypothetical protein [Deltaproteobacteria bacterium]